MFDKPSLHSLVTNGVISNITPLLVDKDHSVREAATGALRFDRRDIVFIMSYQRCRNLVTVGADEFKDVVINNDVTVALLTCIKEVKRQILEVSGIFIYCSVVLHWNKRLLCQVRRRRLQEKMSGVEYWSTTFIPSLL